MHLVRAARLRHLMGWPYMSAQALTRYTCAKGRHMNMRAMAKMKPRMAMHAPKTLRWPHLVVR